MSDCFLGEIRLFAGNYNPENWILCWGQSLSVSQNQALFALIGTTYGGNGVTTFNAPDFRGRVPIGQGTNTNPPLTARTLGQTGGEESHTLVAAEMPAHSHPVYASAGVATAVIPGPTMLYGEVSPNTAAGITGLYTTTVPPAVPVTTLDAKAVGFAGGNQPHNNMMATMAISFIMSIMGNYPTTPN